MGAYELVLMIWCIWIVACGLVPVAWIGACGLVYVDMCMWCTWCMCRGGYRISEIGGGGSG